MPSLSRATLFFYYQPCVVIIDTVKVIRDRIENILAFYESITEEEILSIFVGEYVDQDGTRQYESLWLFTGNYAMEAKDFVATDTFDMARIYQQITYWKIEKQSYDFDKATADSRMLLHFSFLPRLSGTIKGSKKNCDYLKEIFMHYILPNFFERNI